MKIYLDIDDCIFFWQESYAKRFNTKVPKGWSNSKLVKSRLNTLSKEKDFWLNLPVKNCPNFMPSGYVSARGISKNWTRESLKRNNIPGRTNLHQVYWGESKIELLKSLDCEIFVDDKPRTFYECNKNGIFCLLMTAEHNKCVKTKLRIDNLDIENIMSLYRKYKKCI